MADKEIQLDRLRRTLEEVRAHRDVFSDDSFAQLVLLLLEQIRIRQTATVPRVSSADEIRLVTVMFVDIKDSTELIQHFEASDWKAVVARTHTLIADIVTERDGQIGQYLGDGVLCFFGAQSSRGDDAIYAVSSALAIQQAIASYAAELRERYGIDYGLRIGISTGRLVVGMIGSANKQEMLALGTATNLAARLQALAPVGGIVIDATTHARVHRSFTTERQPLVELKGFDSPIQNYLITGKRAPAAQLTDVHVEGIVIPFVGRAHELEYLQFLCELTEAERTLQSTMIVGDIGIGKSRLLQEAIQVTASQYFALTMCAHYESRAQSYNLLRDLLMTQCHLEDSTEAATIRQQITSFVCAFWNDEQGEQAAAALGYLAGFDFVAPDSPQEWVIRWFEQVAQQHNLLLCVDNLQWADEQSVLLLERIAHSLAQTGTIMLTAARPIYRITYPQYMRSHAQYTEIELNRLNSTQARELINNVLKHVERVPAAVPEMIVERAEGNPLFLYEYLDAMFASGIFMPIAENRWRFNIILYDQAVNNIPPALISVLQARLDELPADARQLLQVASIAGQKFWLQSLKAIYDYPSRVAGLLEMLVMRGMIHLDETSTSAHDTCYHFSHTLYREVAYEMLPRPQREQYHRRMAAWLLGNIAGKGDQYPLLAEQFLHAGQYDAALYTYVEAVEENMRTQNVRLSLQLIDQGLAIAKRLPREDALPAVSKLWAQRGQALLAIARFDEASAASQSALMLLGEMARDQLVTTRILAERILGLAYISLGRFNDAYDALTRAHNLLPGSATDQIAAVLRGFATLLLNQGRLEDSYAYQRRATTHAINTEDDQQIGESLRMLGTIDLLRGNLHSAWDCFQRAYALNQKSDHRHHQAADIRYFGAVCMALHDYQAALDYFERGMQLLEDAAPEDVLLNANYALAMLYAGQHLRGKTFLEAAFERGHRDIYNQMRLHIFYIAGLVQLQEYVQAQEQTLAFLQQYDKTNVLLYGKAMYFRGYAAKMLGVPDAASYAHAALEVEQAYGGLDLWMIHELLAQLSMEAEQQQHWKAAAQHLQKRAESLRDLPQLRAALFKSPRVRQIFTEAQVSIPDYDSLVASAVASGVTSATGDEPAGG